MEGPEGCNLLWIAKTGRNHHRRTLLNSADKIERCGKGNTAGMHGKAQPNYSSTRQRSTPYCESGENVLWKAWLGNVTPPDILSWNRAVRLLFVSVDVSCPGREAFPVFWGHLKMGRFVDSLKRSRVFSQRNP